MVDVHRDSETHEGTFKDTTNIISSNEKKTRSEKAWDFAKNTVAEPFFFLMMFGYMSRTTTYHEVIIYKTCIHDLEYNETVCDNLHNFTKQQDEVQRLAGNISMGHSIISIFPSIVALIFLVSFSAKYGRKIPTLLACLGLLLETGGVIFCIIDMHSSSAMIFLLTSIPSGIFGGFVVAITMTMTHLSETAEPEHRPLRFSFVEIVILVSIPAGGAFGGYIRSSLGFIAVFVSAGSLIFLSMVWIFFRMNEPDKKKLSSCKETLKELINLETVKENIRITLMKREGNTRKKIWLLVLAACIYLVVVMGTGNIAFLFAQRSYQWTNYHFSNVNAVACVFQMVGMLVIVPLLTKVIKVHECVLIVIGNVSNAAKFFTWAFASKEGLYYLGCVFGLLSGVSNVGVKSYLSRLVDAKEIGNIFSVLSLCEGLTPLIGIAVWTQIYNAALPQFPGLAYLCSSILLIIPVVIATWMLKVSSDYPKDKNTEDEFSDGVAMEEIKET